MKDYCPNEQKEMIDRFPIGMAYVPWQRTAVTYDNLEKGFENGTIFPQLYKPFSGRRCVS